MSGKKTEDALRALGFDLVPANYLPESVAFVLHSNLGNGEVGWAICRKDGKCFQWVEKPLALILPPPEVEDDESGGKFVWRISYGGGK